jgi:uncharacterized repeat protein (TIGR01451 family)
MLVWNTNGNKVSGVNGAKDLAYSIWNGTSWTNAAFVPVPTTTPSVAGQEPQSIRIAANPRPGSNELVMTVIYHNNVEVAFVWNGTSWGNAIQLVTGNQNNGFTNANVAYSQVSGQALVTYAVGNNTNQVGYRTWNGTWSAQAIVPLPSGLPNGFAQWTVLASDPGSTNRAATNNIVLGVQTSGHAVWMDVWNGTSWGTPFVGTTNGASQQNNQNIAVSFERATGQALAVYQDNLGTTELQFNTWNPTTNTWSTGTPFFADAGNTPAAITLTSNPYSDQVMMMVNDSKMIVQADLWTGTAFAAPNVLTATGTNSASNNGVPMSFFWDSFLPGTVTTQTTFTQTAPMTSPFVMPVGGAVTVTTYIQVTSGALPATPHISVSLSTGGSTFLNIPAPPTVTNLGGGLYKLVWTGTMPNNVTIPTGGQIGLTYTSFDTAYSFNILYGSQTDPSQVQVNTATGIMINSLGVFNAPFPGGSQVITTMAGQPAYVRFTVSDPFGASDITSADVVIKNSAGATVFSTTLHDANVVASTAGSKTYEVAWTPMTADTFSVNITAHEGTEGVTATGQTTITTTAEPDLVVTKSDGGATVNAGGSVAYTIGYSNIGLGNSTGVVLTEFLPTGSTFDAAASTPGWTAVGTSELQLSVGSLPAGASGSVVFAVTVPIPVQAGQTQLVNTVSIADDGKHGPDANPANNSASDATPINAGPDLVVTKTDGGVSTQPGGVVLYQITFSNIGTANSDTVELTENLPANTTFNSTYSDPAWNTEGGGVFTLNVGSLAVGASGTVTFAVNVNSPLPGGTTQIANTVSIGDAGDSGPDLNPNNNTSTDTTPIAVAPVADLQITKTDNVTTVTPGQVVTYPRRRAAPAAAAGWRGGSGRRRRCPARSGRRGCGRALPSPPGRSGRRRQSGTASGRPRRRPPARRSARRSARAAVPSSGRGRTGSWRSARPPARGCRRTCLRGRRARRAWRR